MRSRPADSFDDWFDTPMATPCADPSFEVRRVHPSEFEALYDVVDDAFAVERPRVLYDWFYRKSPLGPARCWALVEKATNEIVNLATRMPWPVAYGDTPVEGAILGDSATRRRRPPR